MVDVSFKLFQALPLSRFPAKVLVTWQMNKGGADLADYEFYVERGEATENIPGFQHVDIYQNPLPATEHSPTVNFVAISKAISGLDNLQYLDYSTLLESLARNFWYRIRCRKISTQEDILSSMFSYEGVLDPVGIYVTDEINFQLEDVSGVPSLVYNRRRGGVPCGKCFDPIQKKRLISQCTNCYGTNWEKGFYDPIDCYVGYDPNPKNALITQWGEVQENQSRLLMSNFPVLQPGDIIREIRTNRLWRVVRVDLTEKRRTLLLQFPVVMEIKPGDVEYHIVQDERLAVDKMEELSKTKKLREF